MIEPEYCEKQASLNLQNIYAIDTETTPFDPPTYGWRGRTRIKPFGGHDLVLGSIAGAGTVSIYRRDSLLQITHTLLDAGAHLVFHNCPFDIPVLLRADATLAPKFFKAVDQCRIHDTAILEVLIQIAVGSQTMNSKQLVSTPSLAKLAKIRCGLDLEKSSSIRLSFGAYLDPKIPLPSNFARYAANDAFATYLIYRSQLSEICVIKDPPYCKFPRYPECDEKYGFLSENIQIRGDLALAWLEQYPLRVDLSAAVSLRDRLETEARRFEKALIHYGWARITPKKREFHLKFSFVRELLKEFASKNHILPEYSDTGLVSLSHDFWSSYIPKISRKNFEHPEQAEALEDRLEVWMRYMRVRKLLSTYIYVYSSSAEHYPAYHNIGARTGRTSSVRPNAQNIPKRRDGIRALFIPQKNHVFIEGDYKFAELVALAQVYYCMYGGSVLGNNIKACAAANWDKNLDPHVATARRLVPEFDTLTTEVQEKLRQAAKAVNFGLPGGLGSRTFSVYAQKTWGLSITEAQAETLRGQAFSSDPELLNYLQDGDNIEQKLRLAAHNLRLPWVTFCNFFAPPSAASPNSVFSKRPNYFFIYQKLRQWALDELTIHLPLPPGFNKKFDLFRQTTCTLTGRIRDRATYTQSHNTPFQGLVSDAGKCALWNLRKAHYYLSHVFNPVSFIHDSILIETSPETSEKARHLLTACMVSGFTHVCPNIPIGVDCTEPLVRWGSNTNPWGETLDPTLTFSEETT